MKPVKKVFVYKGKLSLKPKTKLNGRFVQNGFKYKNNLQLLLKRRRAKKIPSKVFFVGKTARQREGSHLSPKIVIFGSNK